MRILTTRGDETSFDQEDWSAIFDLENVRAVWKKPVTIEAEVAVKIKDSRPFVAMFSNEKGQRKWLEKILTVENIRGRAEMTLENDRLVIPCAFVSSDKVVMPAPRGLLLKTLPKLSYTPGFENWMPL